MMVYFDTERIQLKRDRMFHKKVAEMTQDQTTYPIQNDRLPLAGVFEQVLQRVIAAPTAKLGGILATFAASIVDGNVFNLAQIEQLLDESDRLLCMALFDYCMSDGLSEDERPAASAAFAPCVVIDESKYRH